MSAQMVITPATLPGVASGDESAGKRVARLRGSAEPKVTQKELADEAGVSVGTIYNIEHDQQLDSLPDVEAALDRILAARERRSAPAATLTLIASLLEDAEPEEYRVRKFGKRRRLRVLTIVAREPGMSDEEYAEAVAELHRNRREP